MNITIGTVPQIFNNFKKVDMYSYYIPFPYSFPLELLLIHILKIVSSLISNFHLRFH
jgi:hypothetical protein